MKQEIRYKGEFGYLKYKKRQTRNRALLFLALTLLIFFLGLALFHTNQNYLSIVAALFCIPTGVSFVNMIMFQKATECNDETFGMIETVKGGSLILYDLSMTAYETTYPVLCAIVLENKILCLLSGDRTKCASCETHIREILTGNGHEGCIVNVLDDVGSFCEQLAGMEEERVKKGLDPVRTEDEWTPGTAQTIAGILKSISL